MFLRRCFRFSTPEYLFTKSHEWLLATSVPSEYKLGISNHASDLLGEVVYVENSKVNTKFSRNAVICTLESVKAVGEVFAPFECEVVETNDALKSNPGLVTEKSESDGWLLKLKSTTNSVSLDSFMTSEEYKSFCNTK
jgi:glycine cleavage system H protein